MLRRLLIVFAALIGLVVLAGFLLPARQVVERSLTMTHSPERVWAVLAQPVAWNRWSPWYARDPAMKITYDGAPSGVGARWHWVSQSEGDGQLQIVAATEPRHLDYVVSLGNGGNAIGRFVLEPIDNGTRLTWRLQFDAGLNPIERWFGLMLERWVGPDFEQGLRNINRILTRSNGGG
ncbi:MAG: SRPBCC family protein [Burkholderiaceae bacterium]